MSRASVVLMIDRSDSMYQWNYLEPAKTDAATFVNIMNTGDNLGVVAFSDDATRIFGAANALTQITGQSVQDQATGAIMALKSLNLTNMSDSLKMAYSMIRSSPSPQGVVLLSDGLWTAGDDPRTVLQSSPPVHTIALGHNGEERVLTDIAEKSGGQYHFAPDGLQLAEIYNTIANDTMVAALIANDLRTVPQYKCIGTPGTVPAGSSEACFALNWVDQSVVYTPGTPVGRQVNVFLYDPKGRKVDVPASAVGPGYVVFRIPSPIAGTYTAYTWYAGAGSLAYTAGIFDSLVQINSRLHVSSMRLRAGEPLQFRVQVTDGGEPVRDAAVHASLESPLVSVEEAMETYRDVLAGLPEPEDVPSGADPRRAKLTAFRRQVLPNYDILPRELRPHPIREAARGTYEGVVPGLAKPGSYTVRVQVSGHAPGGGIPFMRSCRVSVLVE